MMVEDKAKRAKEMRNLSQEAREAAIDGSDNVVGYDRFLQRNNQVAIAESKYKRPSGPPKGGHA